MSAIPAPAAVPMHHAAIGACERAQRIRVTGIVQGVGFRPAVWHLAQRHGLRGTVGNDGQGVVIHACGPADALAGFVADLRREAPPLARVDRIACEDGAWLAPDAGFAIVPSGTAGATQTGIAPDAASCAACIAETFDPAARRQGYAFTNCTHCGPRLSIATRIPYDRANTTMRAFPMCAACRAEYDDPADRRFHAQPIACPDCGPQVWLETCDTHRDAALPHEAIAAARLLLQRGAIVAIKGLGGFQLACDAGNADAVARLRARKHRASKPLALMARDLAMVRSYARVDVDEATCLQDPAAPIVLLLRPGGAAALADGIAPGMQTLGFMLPNTPLHHLLLQGMAHPIVLTSGNVSDAPQLTDNDAARAELVTIADAMLLHDRPVARRVDDSVLRVMAGAPRVLRRARGLAPAGIALHPDFAAAAPVLALGGDLKNSFCLLRAGQAVLSHHIGDLRDPRTLADQRRAVEDYRQLFDNHPQCIAIDAHPQSLAGAGARAMVVGAGGASPPALVAVQHHHAHIAACMAENGLPPDTAAVLGIALDGMGYGDDGTLWGGEFLSAGYRGFTRLARLQPVALPGGDAAMREPWRNTYAQLVAAMGWPAFADRYRALELHARLRAKPLGVIDAMLASHANCPPASSAARWFDAVAAACGICFDRIGHEGQAAMELEACADAATLEHESDDRAYPFAIDAGDGTLLPCLGPAPLWPALLDDLQQAVPAGVVSARFHKGLAIAIVHMVRQLRAARGGDEWRSVALSGGVFQNRILLEQLVRRLEQAGLTVLTHRQGPSNDGGLSLGQAAVAAARSLAARATSPADLTTTTARTETTPCA
ncbi:carbamoyltransferase HypF [Comamonadaceae bacterium G21597-S1]|nr:carbamoyltransferase HypF [Comamonadaceae bacterium G21597-S1]